MAKPFYSMEEVCAKLGKSEDDVRGMVRDGSLREFRDAGKIFFKAEDVDRMAGGDAGDVSLEPAEDDLPTLADTSGGTSVIGLEPVEEDSQEKSPAKTDTSVPSGGIGVFEDDELEVDADPMAATQITDSAADDQVQIDSSGSGSGLLDLTREADDTSLGAELLDEIYPGEEDSATEPAGARSGTAAAEAVEEPEAEEAEADDDEALPAADAGAAIAPAVTAAPAGDPTEGVFGGLLVSALILLALGGSVAAGGLQGYVPGFAEFLAGNFLIYMLGGTAGVVILSVLIGWVLGRATNR